MSLRRRIDAPAVRWREHRAHERHVGSRSFRIISVADRLRELARFRLIADIHDPHLPSERAHDAHFDDPLLGPDNKHRRPPLTSA